VIDNLSPLFFIKVINEVIVIVVSTSVFRVVFQFVVLYVTKNVQ